MKSKSRNENMRDCLVTFMTAGGLALAVFVVKQLAFPQSTAGARSETGTMADAEVRISSKGKSPIFLAKIPKGLP